MSATTMQSTPAIPPRPSRSHEKGDGLAIPVVPPRPAGRGANRSISPNPDRFAPSPLNDSPFPNKRPNSIYGSSLSQDPIERSASVDIPMVAGEEGQEYAALAESTPEPETGRRGSTSPEQTRTVGEDVQLHAPKPTVPAQSAKQRVATVTRTDSDKAASYGIGKPTGEEPPYSGRSLKKKASTASQLSQASSHYEDDIPEIGQRVPMYRNAGDVQAPSPAPSAGDGTKSGRAHTRRLSARGFNDLPPGSYGLHGHGVASTDKLEKAYYEKHPDLVQKEQFNQLHDRVQDYSLSSDELNKIVRDTAKRNSGYGTSNFISTPSEQIGFQATEEYTSRMSSPMRPASAHQGEAHGASPLKNAEGQDIIHVDDPGRYKGYAKFGDEVSAVGASAEDYQEAPILAADEVENNPTPYELHAAVQPPPERSGSAFEMEEPKSRPTSRPASIYSPAPQDLPSAPLEDVREYEPLFPEGGKSDQHLLSQAEKLKEMRRRFPSRDIWEDAPNSVHATAEVSTPDLPEQVAPSRDTETPAQAFARKHEELAEKELQDPEGFLHRQQQPIPSHAEHQVQVSKEERPASGRRFPSRDVWEDSPDSLQMTTTVSQPQMSESQTEETRPTGDSAAVDKPLVPTRPKKQGSGDDKPVIPDRPKPHVPARPAKSSPLESKEGEPVARSKPAVPARPVGGKIAALQAGFMSDLNKRLQLGPQAPKKEEPVTQDLTEEKEKAPLADARKGRARGPQRRAPGKSPSSGGDSGRPTLSFSTTRTLWCIDEEGTMTVEQQEEEPLKEEKTRVEHIEVPADDEDDEEEEEKKQTETKTIAANTAGEPILQETIEKKASDDQVEAVQEVTEEVQS